MRIGAQDKYVERTNHDIVTLITTADIDGLSRFLDVAANRQSLYVSGAYNDIPLGIAMTAQFHSPGPNEGSADVMIHDLRIRASLLSVILNSYEGLESTALLTGQLYEQLCGDLSFTGQHDLLDKITSETDVDSEPPALSSSSLSAGQHPESSLGSGSYVTNIALDQLRRESHIPYDDPDQKSDMSR